MKKSEFSAAVAAIMGNTALNEFLRRPSNNGGFGGDEAVRGSFPIELPGPDGRGGTVFSFSANRGNDIFFYGSFATTRNRNGSDIQVNQEYLSLVDDDGKMISSTHIIRPGNGIPLRGRTKTERLESFVSLIILHGTLLLKVIGKVTRTFSDGNTADYYKFAVISTPQTVENDAPQQAPQQGQNEGGN